NNAFDAMRTLSAERSAQGESYSPKLTLSTKSDNGQILIEVQDNGPGIPEEMKDLILQPFFTTKKGTDGTGLGLSITNDIIKAHGGDLEIRSEPGVGTIFIIKLTK
ncbi:MAG: sensor histidine kinase, partial [Bacteroidota bacterium]